MSIFPTASNANMLSFNTSLVFNEIRTLERKVLDQIALQLFTATVNTGTVMTASDTGQAYYNSWKATSVNKVLDDQMNTVIKYFQDLGYSIVRKLNTNTNNTFFWELKW
jgi:hypothetical protein